MTSGRFWANSAISADFPLPASPEINTIWPLAGQRFVEVGGQSGKFGFATNEYSVETWLYVPGFNGFFGCRKLSLQGRPPEATNHPATRCASPLESGIRRPGGPFTS